MSESNDKGKWHGWEIEKVGAVEDAGVYEMAKSFAASIKAGEVKAKPQEENAKEGKSTQTKRTLLIEKTQTTG